MVKKICAGQTACESNKCDKTFLHIKRQSNRQERADRRLARAFSAKYFKSDLDLLDSTRTLLALRLLLVNRVYG